MTKKSKFTKLNGAQAYPDSSFEPPNRYGSESENDNHHEYIQKNASKFKNIWGHANNENENSSGIEIIRSARSSMNKKLKTNHLLNRRMRLILSIIGGQYTKLIYKSWQQS